MAGSIFNSDCLIFCHIFPISLYKKFVFSLSLKPIQSTRQLWKYAIWPIALLLVCVMVAGVVYFLIAGQNFSSHPPHEQYTKKHGNPREPNAINFLNNYNSINRVNRPNESRRNDTPLNVLLQQETHPNINVGFSTARVPTTLRPSSSTSSNIFVSSTTTKTTTTKRPKPQAPAKPSSVTILPPTAATTNRPSYESNRKETSTVKNVKIYTNSSPRRKLPQPAPKHTTLLLPTADDLEENAVEKSKLLFPSKETLENFGFTSGHQNSFGIPIEEDERILRMLNHQLASQSSEPKLSQSNDYILLSITTDANIHQTKVSPTLPNIKKNFATTERIRPVNVTTEDGNSHYRRAIFFLFTRIIYF